MLNALAGHFNSFGNNAPLPKKRLDRIVKVPPLPTPIQPQVAVMDDFHSHSGHMIKSILTVAVVLILEIGDIYFFTLPDMHVL